MKLSKKEQLHLLMADAAYQNEKPLEELKSMGWKKITRFCNGETSCFAKGRQVVVAFRGSQSRKDFATDVKAIALGGNTASKDQRFRDSIQATKKIVTAFAGKTLSVTGHSLGGTLAEFVGRAFCVGGTAFNPGSSPITGLRATMEKVAEKAAKAHLSSKNYKRCAKVKIIRIADDSKNFRNDKVSSNAKDNFPGSKVKHLSVDKPSDPYHLHITSQFYNFF